LVLSPGGARGSRVDASSVRSCHVAVQPLNAAPRGPPPAPARRREHRGHTIKRAGAPACGGGPRWMDGPRSAEDGSRGRPPLLKACFGAERLPCHEQGPGPGGAAGGSGLGGCDSLP
jgi:hypothetical protein